jgi:anti-sigma B factor antagonist
VFTPAAISGEIATMKLTQRHRNGVLVLEPQGKITIGRGDIALRHAVDEGMAAGARRILIDLKKTASMDSSGIAELVAAQAAVKAEGGELKLLNLPPKIQDVLSVTQLITVFDIFDDEREALLSFTEPVAALA